MLVTEGWPSGFLLGIDPSKEMKPHEAMKYSIISLAACKVAQYFSLDMIDMSLTIKIAQINPTILHQCRSHFSSCYGVNYSSTILRYTERNKYYV